MTLNDSEIDMSGIPGFTSHGIYTYDGGSVIINGGTYVNNATDQNATGGSVINGAISVNDGSFSGRIQNYYGTPVPKGGEYDVQPSVSFVAEGYLAENVDDKWVVKPVVASIGGMKYTSLEKAFADGGEITLLRDVDMGSDNITISRDVKLNLNGKTISGVCNEDSEPSMFFVPNEFSMIIDDTVGGGKITYARGSHNTGYIVDLEGELTPTNGILEITGSDWNIVYAVDVRPNAWGIAYTNPTVFTMNGGSIISSDSAVRAASSSLDTYINVSASFVMTGGTIDADWDGVFIQQSNETYDILLFIMNGGTIRSDEMPIRFYGPDAKSVVNNVVKPMTLELNGGSLVLTGEPNRTWFVENSIAYGGGMTLDNLNKYLDYTSQSIKT